MAVVQVKAKAGEDYRQEITVGNHHFAADVPADKGGMDTAPTPHEMLMGALGACTTITIQMYAKRKEWALKGVSVKVTEEPIEVDGKKASKFTREIDLEGNLTAEQIDGLKAIADKCPIHKILTAQNQVVTAVAHKV
ncbi:MAG: OsmC family protein [Cyanobacteria bacterium REEB67]|jgi:putative redox protein|nr:OsmC family protein [Cyanobacteria bacterium REEB67]